MSAPPDDGVLKHMFGAFVQRSSTGGSRRPANSPRGGEPTDELRRMATEHIRSGKTFHTPPSGNRDRHGSKSGTGFFSGMFGSGKPSGGAGAAASSVHQPSTSHAGGNRMKSAKGGGDKGKGLPTTSTEEAPPTKRTRTLHRSQSAHPSTARSAVRSPPSAHHEGAGSSKRNFPCEQCSSSFTQRGQLLRHVRRVHEHLRPYACQLCGSKFGARSDRNRHIQIVHNKTSK